MVPSSGSTSGSSSGYSYQYPMSASERMGIEWSVRSTSVLSILGCIYVLVRFFLRPKATRDVSGMLVATLAAIELIISVAKMPALDFVVFKRSTNGSKYFIDFQSQPSQKILLCHIQSFFLDSFMLQTVLWNGCMALNLLRWVVYRDSEEKLQSRFWVYFFATSFFCVAWGLTAGLPIWPAINDGDPSAMLFDFSRFYCWIRRDYILYRYVPFVVLTLLFIVAAVLKVCRTVYKRATSLAVAPSSDRIVSLIQRQLFFYVLGFLCLYTPATIFRLLDGGAEIQGNSDWRKAHPHGWNNQSNDHGNGTGRGQFNSSWSQFSRNNSFNGSNDKFNGTNRGGGGWVDDDDDHSPEFAIASQVFLNLQGFVIAVIYAVFHRHSLSPTSATTSRKNSLSSQGHPSSVFLEDVRSEGSGTVVLGGGDGISIFASTFNMAEGVVPHDLETWIPSGHDVYVIGVQECLSLPALRTTIASYLHASHGTPFVEYGREIGRKETKLGYHGFIAVTVYVRAVDVHAGNFYMHVEAASKVHRGANLMGLGRASNKGAVGFAFRYFNTTFAVVTCHLTSDSTGKSKVKKRHQDGTSILSGMNLQSIGNEFDCHLMAHHTIFMGDLNYRLTARDASPDRILTAVTAILHANRQTSFIKRGQVFSHDQLLLPQGYRRPSLEEESGGKYMLTSTPSAVTHDTELEEGLTTLQLRLSDVIDSVAVSTPHVVDTISWSSLLDHDELKRSMDDGVVFYDFDEARISFAPTYRRVLNSILDPKLPWTVDQVAQLYTVHLGEGKVRVPSYTDRILFHSLPGLRERFVCVQYNSAEAIGTSDHKPVSCVFEALVDKQIKSPASSPPGGGLARSSSTKSEPLPRLKLFTVHLTSLHLKWGPALEKFASDGEDDSSEDSSVRSSVKAVDRHHQSVSSDLSGATTLSGASIKPEMVVVDDGVRVRSVFPLPCEDEFAEERQLAEVADTLLFGTSGTKRRLQPTWKLNTWAAVASHGLKQTVVLPSSRKQLHVALNFVDAAGATLGQCVVGLSEASYRFGRKVDFVAALTVGGRRTGEVQGKVSLHIEKTMG
ncbi:Aste57867_20142 [Aphanomyces stellatus]|uniref:Aste57867_20142 protein n=1 Tax=Aphanomyces stellatus TaxID=120398 RepID=A0A485LEF3_9STRA|nr:hypothetical protein As57867_020076 [Aphanomyces stellatus]VFT96837.1 Aste57867_20142 [Aphanomyces stellatus]